MRFSLLSSNSYARQGVRQLRSERPLAAVPLARSLDTRTAGLAWYLTFGGTRKCGAGRLSSHQTRTSHPFARVAFPDDRLGYSFGSRIATYHLGTVSE